MLWAPLRGVPRKTSPREMNVLVTAAPSHMLSRHSLLMSPPACALIRQLLSLSRLPFPGLPAGEESNFGAFVRPMMGLAEALRAAEGDACRLLSMSGMLLMSASDSALRGGFTVLRQMRGIIDSRCGPSSFCKAASPLSRF